LSGKGDALDMVRLWDAETRFPLALAMGMETDGSDEKAQESQVPWQRSDASISQKVVKA
jgi:hypothetical protein